MNIIGHLVLFLFSAAVIWFFAGLLVESVNNVARRFNQSGFTIAFFVLGFLTSISEISVMINSTLNKAPQISAGNLVGATFVILLLIVPIMAILADGIKLTDTLKPRSLAVALIAAALPAFFLLDGAVTKQEGLLCFLVYATLIYFVRAQHSQSLPRIIKAVEKDLAAKNRTTSTDLLKIALGASLIFLAGHLLVDEAVYFSYLLSIPTSITGLLILSLGTNIPEIVIAIRAIMKKHPEIAFGDYIGSAVTNTLIFAFLPFLNGHFTVEATEFIATAILIVMGFSAFFAFAKSKNTITRREGFALITLYATFLLVQSINFIRFATD